MPMLYLLAPVSFMIVASGTYALCSRLFSPHQLIHRRLRSLQEFHYCNSHKVNPGLLFRGSLWKPATSPVDDKTIVALEQAGLHTRKGRADYRVARLLCLVTATPMAALVWRYTLVDPSRSYAVISLAGVIGLIFGPQLWLARVTKARVALFRRSVPDFIDLMVVCLDAGLAFRDAIKRVSDELQELHPELARELVAVQRDVEMGLALPTALAAFAERTQSEGLKIMANLIKESTKYGTDVIESLRAHSDALRAQRELAAEELAQRASVKVVLPVVLCILPAIFVVIAGPAFMHLRFAFGPPKPVAGIHRMHDTSKSHPSALTSVRE